MKKIAVLTGAGISAESGINTFRDAGGLWEGHDVMEVASIEGWHKNQKLVLDFYNRRRAQLNEVFPNPAHEALTELATKYHVDIITQNVDDLHERAGSKNVLHLHGELRKMRSSKNEDDVRVILGDINIGDHCPAGFQYRPHIVWFGEQVPLLDHAIEIVRKAHIIIIIGTSMQVYPAAGLVGFAALDAEIIFVDPNPQISFELSLKKNQVHQNTAVGAIPTIVADLLSKII